MTPLKLSTMAIAIVATASPATAQEQVVRDPFTGPRGEVLVGYDEGLLYGAAIGYDASIGNLVAGVEAELTDSTATDCIEDILGRFCARAGRDFYLGGRLGAVIGTSTLLYGKAGYTNARVDYGFTNGPGAGDFQETLQGFRIGAGLEKALGRSAYVKGEYRYSNYRDGADGHHGLIGIGVRF
jgi:outer membrane immunogenic protein